MIGLVKYFLDKEMPASIKVCPSCGKQMLWKITNCPKCGVAVPVPKHKVVMLFEVIKKSFHWLANIDYRNKRDKRIILGLVFSFFALYSVGLVIYQNTDEFKKKEAVSQANWNARHVKEVTVVVDKKPLSFDNKVTLSDRVETGEPLYIRSDSGATYLVLSKNKTGGGVELLARRTGSSSISYSLILFDCNGSYRYLGTGDTRAAAEAKSNSDTSKIRINEKSIKAEQEAYACH